MRERWKQFLFVGTVGAAFIVAVLGWSGRSSAQVMPVLLQITSPANGTVVHPGQTVTVVVTRNSGDAFTQVFVEGRDLGSSRPLSAPPYQLSLTIPPKIAAGSHDIRAYGIRPGQNAGESKPLDLDVEPGVPITKIRLDSRAITFKHAGG
jgi:hypothetical protein